jgi:hypothetical protein
MSKPIEPSLILMVALARKSKRPSKRRKSPKVPNKLHKGTKGLIFKLE